MRQGLNYQRLETLDMPSGLGNSAWALYGLTRAYKPKVVVEIGSAQGNSTCHIGMALKANGMGRLYAIDPHTQTDWNDTDSVNTYGILRSNLRNLKISNHVQIVRKTSDEAFKDWKLPIDLLFIDGDHSYDGVKRDWEMFSPFVREFGVVIFHDTLWLRNPDPEMGRANMGVPDFVEELREQGYPVTTIDRNFGVSLIQPIIHGVPLRP